MSVQDAAVSADPALSTLRPLPPLRLRTLLLLAGAVLGCGLLHAVAVGHAPQGPTGAGTATAQVLGWLAVTTAPLAGSVGLLVAGVDLAGSVRERRALPQLAPAAAVVALSVAVLVVCAVLSPLDAWWVD